MLVAKPNTVDRKLVDIGVDADVRNFAALFIDRDHWKPSAINPDHKPEPHKLGDYRKLVGRRKIAVKGDCDLILDAPAREDDPPLFFELDRNALDLLAHDGYRMTTLVEIGMQSLSARSFGKIGLPHSGQ
jgi:hypothetical protein